MCKVCVRVRVRVCVCVCASVLEDLSVRERSITVKCSEYTVCRLCVSGYV